MPDQSIERVQETTIPTTRELVMVLFRQGRVFLCVSGLIFALAVVYAFAGITYQAHIRVLVRRGRSDPPATAQPNAPPDFSRVEVTEEELNSEVELLKDDDVLRRVVEENRLAAYDWLHWLRPNEGAAAKVQRAAKKLSQKLDVEAIKKTNLIAVTYKSADPELAANVLKSLATAYLDKHMEVHRPGGELHFFDRQAGESRRQLEEAEEKLRSFTGGHQVVMAAQQRDLMLQRIAEVDARYRQTDVDISETAHRIEQLRSQLAQLPERTTTLIRSADNPDLLRAMKARLMELQLKRIELVTKFEPGHRLVQEVDQQIVESKNEIAAEGRAPLRDETTDQSSNYEWFQLELQKALVEMKGLVARKAATGSHLAAYQSMVRQLSDDAIVQDDLTSSEKAAQENYLLYVKKREEARMSDALDQGGIVNVALAERPVVPALPVWPVGAVVVVGLMAGVISGTGAAFAADYMDPALHTPEEVFACLEIPVLASLPEERERRLTA